MDERSRVDGADGSRAGFSRRLGAKIARKLNARRNGAAPVWFGLGMMGLIGWSVTVPTLLGAALGNWLDAHHPGGRSWTLALLVLGLCLGCWNAWYWLAQQSEQVRRSGDPDDV